LANTSASSSIFSSSSMSRVSNGAGLYPLDIWKLNSEWLIIFRILTIGLVVAAVDDTAACRVSCGSRVRRLFCIVCLCLAIVLELRQEIFDLNRKFHETSIQIEFST
jgi:hypothetical protein